MNKIRNFVRSGIRLFARLLNAISKGRLSPSAVTIFGVLAHLPIAWLIAQGRLGLAGGLLIIFGLFDALDGELARLQNRATSAGMLLDASTDRIKEVFIYTGAAYFFINNNFVNYAPIAVAACGASLIVSYIKAKGEAAIASIKLDHHKLNRIFSGGLFSFEVRIFLLVLGLFIGRLHWAVLAVAIGASLTALNRLVVISSKLKSNA